MSTNENSPGVSPGAISPELTTTSDHHSADSYAHYIRGLHQRRATSRRIPPLACGHVDPWTCFHHKDDPTDVQVDGAAAAGEYLRSLGLAPVFPVTMCRALYRRGYRELASALGSRWVA